MAVSTPLTVCRLIFFDRGLCLVVQIPHRPPAAPDALFGWGTDWVVGVATPAAAAPGEDVIDPPWCQDFSGNASFVESVMKRREKGRDSSERVRVVRVWCWIGFDVCMVWVLLLLL